MRLKFKIMLGILVAAVMFSVCVSFFINTLIGDLRIAKLKSVDDHLANLNKSIAAQFYERYGDAQAFAQNEILRTQNELSIQNALNNYAKLYGIYDLILFISPEGKLIASNNVSPQGNRIDKDLLKQVNYADTEWFKKLSHNELSEDVALGFTGTLVADDVHDQVYHEIFKNNYNLTLFAAPVSNDSQVIGYIVNYANPVWYQQEVDFFKKELEQEHLSKIELIVLNQKQNEISFFSSDTPQVKAADLVLGMQKQKIDFNKNATFAQLKENFEDKTVLIKQQNDKKMLKNLEWKSVLILDNDILYSEAINFRNKFYIFISVLLVLALGGLYPLIGKLTNVLASITQKLNALVEYNHTLLQSFHESTDKLVSTSQQQDAAVQESVSAMTQINLMIGRTSENMTQTVDSTNQAEGVIRLGQEMMTQVNQQMRSLLKTNESLKSISQVMQSISNQTQLINEIVFKTQLLSFNASIEAARAGENGRGFAVVAEEVGQLSISSGQAAQDIESLIEKSHTQIDSTLQGLADEIHNAVSQVETTSEKFKEINTAIALINEQMKKIEEASEQQKIGVNQTQTSMLHLAESVKNNTNLSSDFAQKFAQLSEKTAELSTESFKLKKLVEGKSEPVQNAA